MRLFLAVELSDAAREHLASLQAVLRGVGGGAAWTRPANLHITLKFLGEVEDARLPELCDALGRVSLDAVETRAVELVCFPPGGSVRIVAARFDDAAGRLAANQQRLEGACEELGFAAERRAYIPHATLARARGSLPASMRPRMVDAARRFWPGPSMQTRRVVLFQSVLDSRGATYTATARFGEA